MSVGKFNLDIVGRTATMSITGLSLIGAKIKLYYRFNQTNGTYSSCVKFTCPSDIATVELLQLTDMSIEIKQGDLYLWHEASIQSPKYHLEFDDIQDIYYKDKRIPTFRIHMAYNGAQLPPGHTFSIFLQSTTTNTLNWSSSTSAHKSSTSAALTPSPSSGEIYNKSSTQGEIYSGEIYNKSSTSKSSIYVESLPCIKNNPINYPVNATTKRISDIQISDLSHNYTGNEFIFIANIYFGNVLVCRQVSSGFKVISQNKKYSNICDHHPGTPVKQLIDIGQYHADQFNRLGIYTIKDISEMTDETFLDILKACQRISRSKLNIIIQNCKRVCLESKITPI